MNRRTIGILGGMGPLATADLYQKIIHATPARADQEHLPVVIYADPSVPDRTAALLGSGEDPVPWLIRGAQRLADAGADFIVMPCNTAHAFLDQVQPHCSIPFVDMIDEAAKTAREHVPAGSVVGILATTGTVTAGLYQAALERHELSAIVPEPREQALVMETIGQVKAGTVNDQTVEPVLTAANALERAGATALLAACTELPVVLQQELVAVPLIDPTDVLARAAVRLATDDQSFEAMPQGTGIVRSHVS